MTLKPRHTLGAFFCLLSEGGSGRSLLDQFGRIVVAVATSREGQCLRRADRVGQRRPWGTGESRAPIALGLVSGREGKSTLDLLASEPAPRPGVAPSAGLS
jgi:hypothetical protein